MKVLFFWPSRCEGSLHRFRPSAGFSLVEVVLAVAVASFGLLSVLALLPIGLQTTRDSVSESVAVNVLSDIIADRQATPLTLPSTIYTLPALTTGMSQTSGTFDVTSANQITTSLSQAQYRVDYTLVPPGAKSLGPYLAYLRVSWPPAAAQPAGVVESSVSIAQP